MALKKKQAEQPTARQVRLDWQPLPKQKLALESPAFEVLFGGSAGGGKAIDITTPIATPDGFVALADLQPGNRVFGISGDPVNVVACSEIMHQRPCYRLVFDDGSDIVADADHQWLTFDADELAALTKRDPEWRAARRAKRKSRSAIGAGQKWQHTDEHRAFLSQSRIELNKTHHPDTLPLPTGSLRTTAEIAATLRTAKGRANHAIQVCQPLDLYEYDLPIDAYSLGLWLGDGTSSSANFATADTELLTAFTDQGYRVTKHSAKYCYGITGGFQTSLRELGVLNNKHIPDIYLWASVDQRIALLRGLMDTDGGVGSGSAEFCNTNYNIALGVKFLINSLGMKATMREKRAKLYDKDCGPCWVIKFRPNRQVFRLKRKADHLQLATRRTTKFRYIVDAYPVDSVPVRCIQVDAPDGLYLAGYNLIPTHNSSLAVAIARLYHKKSLLLRRAFPDLERSLILASLEMYGSENRKYYNAGKHVWNFTDAQQRIEFGHIKDLNAMRQDFSGPEYDLICFDELTQFDRPMYQFMLSRLRSTAEGQRVRVLACTNPGDVGNDWVMERWAAWLDEGYPNPAKAGDVRWFKPGPDDREVETTADDPDALSRTFIPATLDDNPYLPDEYRKQLNALPEPWRSQLLFGKWQAGLHDDPYQIVPTEWIRQAQARWQPDGRQGFLTNVGVDPARAGQDKTVLAPRYGTWVGNLTKMDGRLTPTGYSVVQLMLPILARGGYGVIDVIGIGSAVLDAAKENKLDVDGVNVSSPTLLTDKSGKIRMVNLRAYLYWKLREALDPEGVTLLALPPDPELLGELRATKWESTTRGIKIIDKDEIRDRLGRSPNCADAVMLTMREPQIQRGGVGRVF